MATSTLVPLSEYLRTSYRPDCDWVDGQVRERNMGEGQHASVQGFLFYVLRGHGAEWSIRAYPELRVQTSEFHYRVVDVCVVERSAPFEALVRTPPLLCVEVLSKDDRMSEMQEKIEDYLGMGVRTVWVIDPLRRKASNTDYGLALPVKEELTVKGTEIRISVREIFAELDDFDR
jgi:Uma2 family endonuclease